MLGASVPERAVSDPIVPWTIAWTLVFLAALLAAGWRGAHRVAGGAKTLASLGFLATALAAGALETAYGRVVLGALVLCALGDVLLIARGAGRAFLAGLVSFLLGHLGFAVAFAVRGISLGVAAGAIVLLIPVIFAVMRWLGPHVPPDMRIPVRAYVGVISAMVVTAAGATAAGGPISIAIGAVLFYLSDLSVARDRFVAPGPVNGLWGLPLYYGGQLFLAVSVAA